MSVVFTDNFTVVADTNIDAYPGGGADYAHNIGSSGNVVVNAANDRVQQVTTGADALVRIIDGAVPTDGTGQISFTGFSASAADCAVSPGVRIKTDGTGNGYIMYCSDLSSTLELYRIVTGGFTQIASGSRALSPPQTTTLKAVTNGSQVDLTGTYGGVADLTFSDTNAARHLTGAPGFHMFSDSANLAYIDDISVDNLSVGRTTKNTRAFPLGIEVGMNFRG